jgi:hypothetical protein
MLCHLAVLECLFSQTANGSEGVVDDAVPRMLEFPLMKLEIAILFRLTTGIAAMHNCEKRRFKG